MEFRVAAFYRLMGNINKVTIDNTNYNKSLLEKLIVELDDAPGLENLAGMILQMNIDRALARFPFNDLTVIADMVIYMVNYYKTNPTLVDAVSSSLTNCQPDKDSRMQEILSLNYKFAEMSKTADLVLRAEFFESHNHAFHPASQFIRITATI